MYESPINAFYNEMITKLNERFDNGVLEAVTRVDINVDRDELIKALSYDRGQYDKGFSDGLEEGKPKWISVKDRLPDGEDPVLIFVKETEHYGLHKEKRKVYYCQYLAYWDGDEWLTTWCNGCRKISDTAKEPYADDYEVTHWMPLPEPPKEE